MTPGARPVRRGVLAAVLASVALLACADAAQRPERETPVLEFRVAETEPGPGLEPVEYGGRTLYLEPDPVLSDDDFEAVRAAIGPSGVVLGVRMEEPARERLRSVAEARMGNPLAVLVEGRVRAAPVLRSPVGTVSAWHPIGLTVMPEEAGAILEAVRERWPRAQMAGDYSDVPEGGAVTVLALREDGTAEIRVVGSGADPGAPEAVSWQVRGDTVVVEGGQWMERLVYRPRLSFEAFGCQGAGPALVPVTPAATSRFDEPLWRSESLRRVPDPC